MSSILEKIRNNPFRLLGVYANASIRDIKSNEAKTKAFLNVGKEVCFPCDFNDLLSPIKRTSEMMDTANSQLTLPNDKIAHALFWFVKETSLDEIAFNHLQSGFSDKAIEIWEKRECYSSLLNTSTLSIVKGQYVASVNSMIKLLENKQFRLDFITTINDSTFKISKEDLWHIYLDEFISKEAVAKLFLNIPSLPDICKIYIKDQLITPIITDIENEISKAKSIRHENSTERYNAGCRLLNLRRGKLTRLQELLSSMDMQYQMLVDKLGLEILQCGIDYYNNSDEDDAAEKAMVLQNAAQSIVVGQIAKDRCKENTDILRRIISELPPKELRAEDRAIKKELEKFCQLPDRIRYAIELLNNTRPHLQIIKSRAVVGNAYSYYLKISTQIAGNALHNLIEEINSIQNNLEQSVEKILRERFPNYHSVNRETMKNELIASSLQNILKPALDKAWEAILLIDKLDLETNFKINSYNPNRDTLKKMREQLEPRPTGGHGGSSGGNGSGSGGSSGSGCVIWLLLAITLGTIISCI